MDYNLLDRKQGTRKLEVFLSKLKDIKIVIEREVSEINKNVAEEPLLSGEVLDQINKRYNLGIHTDDFKMESSVDTMGEHFVTASFFSDHFEKEFKFLIKLIIREKKKVVTTSSKHDK